MTRRWLGAAALAAACAGPMRAYPQSGSARVRPRGPTRVVTPASVRPAVAALPAPWRKDPASPREMEWRRRLRRPTAPSAAAPQRFLRALAGSLSDFKYDAAPFLRDGRYFVAPIVGAAAGGLLGSIAAGPLGMVTGAVIGSCFGGAVSLGLGLMDLAGAFKL